MPAKPARRSYPCPANRRSLPPPVSHRRARGDVAPLQRHPLCVQQEHQLHLSAEHGQRQLPLPHLPQGPPRCLLPPMVSARAACGPAACLMCTCTVLHNPCAPPLPAGCGCTCSSSGKAPPRSPRRSRSPPRSPLARRPSNPAMTCAAARVQRHVRHDGPRGAWTYPILWVSSVQEWHWTSNGKSVLSVAASQDGLRAG